LVRRRDAKRAGGLARTTAVSKFSRPQFVERGLELLISVLHLLDLTGQLTNLVLQTINSDHKLRGARLRKSARRGRHDEGGCNSGKSDAVQHRSHRPAKNGSPPTIAAAASKL
jgi:hypothetical protein